MRLKVYYGKKEVIHYMIVLGSAKIRDIKYKFMKRLEQHGVLVRDVKFSTRSGKEITDRTTFKEAFGDLGRLQTAELIMKKK